MKLLIKGGRIVDPAQNMDRLGDLLVENGKIAGAFAPGKAPEADRTIDAFGRVVAPGFIDIHMHEDPFDPETGELRQDISRSMLLMGVTTALGGNCGDNYGDPRKYLDYVDAHGNCMNIGLFAGHTWIREACGGMDKYAPVSDSQIDAMERLAADCLAAGCMGVSFGVKYVPGTSPEEMTRLAALCTPSGRLVTSHVRNDVSRVFAAVKEMDDLAKATGCRVQISHIGSMGGYGQMKQLLRDVEGYAASGTDIMCDCYPYTAFSTYIGSTTYDPENYAEYHAPYSAILMSTGRYAGQRCTKEIYDWERANAPEDITVGFLMVEEDVDMALRHPLVMVGSDGLRHGDQGHPRAAGAFPRYIAEYIRTGKVGFMEGMAKTASLAAERLNLPHKGNLRPGSDADIVIFDYDAIRDTATFEEPALVPEGIDYVLIGGEIAADHGQIVKEKLGRAVRFGAK
ncbi:MAG: amidohydrolase family protein [Clostridia bacterium]|nr:amidohydrolase family protein [Clostridia bacterium]